MGYYIGRKRSYDREKHARFVGR